MSTRITNCNSLFSYSVEFPFTRAACKSKSFLLFLCDPKPQSMPFTHSNRHDRTILIKKICEFITLPMSFRYTKIEPFHATNIPRYSFWPYWIILKYEINQIDDECSCIYPIFKYKLLWWWWMLVLEWLKFGHWEAKFVITTNY